MSGLGEGGGTVDDGAQGDDVGLPVKTQLTEQIVLLLHCIGTSVTRQQQHAA